MFWVDEIVEDIIQKYPQKKKFIIRDEKTLSGRVHVGSLRGFVIHGVVAQALKERGFDVEYIFEFNDADPMDGLPSYLDQEKYLPFMGQPLYTVPSPVEGFKNFAEYYGDEFLKVINKLGFYPKIVHGRDLYQQGYYDPWIKKIIQHPAEIRKIYQEVSGSEKPQNWYPLQVVCENCGKIGSTKVTGIDGDKVAYECLPDMVSWAKGCGHHGVTSPYGGRGKLPWKPEWAVKWASLGVNIEGAGKDHTVAGGSHDISARIATEVLGVEVPYNIPYEHFLLGGKKMSSSKGLGASSKEISDLLPPELLRFLMSKNHFSRPIDFNPYGTAVPVLFDQYDESANQYFSQKPSFPDQGRAFYFSQVTETKPVEHFLPRFSKLMFYLQLPRVNPLAEFEKNTHRTLTEIEKKELETRSFYAKQWLENYAPDEFKFEVKADLPGVSLNKDQKEFLKQITTLLQSENLEGDQLHTKIHEIRKNSPLNPRDAFQAIYLTLLGKDSGPQAGWFLESLDKNFVIQRFLAAQTLPEEKPTNKTSLVAKSADPSVVGWKNTNVIIGQIDSINPHPNADGLNIYRMKISDTKSLSIISGCKNLKVGDIVAVALKNARIFAPDGSKNKVDKGRIRGYESEAVLCSSLELGLGNDHTTIHLLDPSFASFLGEPLSSHFPGP